MAFTLKGFTTATSEVEKKLTIASRGRERKGKSHFAFSLPGPIGAIVTDKNTLPIIAKMVREQKKEIVYRKYIRTAAEVASIERSKPAEAAAAHVKYWDDIQADYYTLVGDPRIRSVVVDKASTLWEYCRLAHHGRLEKVQAREYGAPNRDMSDMINACDKNMILTHNSSEEWKDGKGSGKDKMEGYKETPYLCSVVIEHYRKDNGVFGIRILNSTANADYYEGAPDAVTCLNGDDCTFAMLAFSIYPETSPDEWE